MAPPGTNGLAIASLVLSLLWFGGIGALLAIVLGAIAVGQVRRTNQNGHGLATAGIVLGIIGLVVPIFFVLVVFVSRGVVDKDPSIHGGSGGSGGGTNSGQSMACETEQRTVRTAVEAFYAQQGRWPRSNAELVGDYLRAAPRNYAVMPDGSGRVVVKEPSPDDCQ